MVALKAMKIMAVNKRVFYILISFAECVLINFVHP